MCVQLRNYFLKNIVLFSILVFSSKIKVALNKLISLLGKLAVAVGSMVVSDQYGISRMNYLRILGIF